MKTAKRLTHTRIMKSAWELADRGAKHFGGGAHLYFREALRLIWEEEKSIAVFVAGLGNQMWMSFVPQKQQVRRGQIALPGLSLK